MNPFDQYKEQVSIGDSLRAQGGIAANHKDDPGLSSFFRYDKEGTGLNNNAYKEHAEKENLLDEAVKKDGKSSKDYMVVMAGTMSDEDYKKLQEGGGDPGDYEPGEMVTVMDQIKVVLAQAGVEVAGYTDNIDASTVTKITGNAGYATSIMKALDKTDLPASEKNILGIAEGMKMAESITELSDGAKKYLLENEEELTIDNLYKASHVGAADSNRSSGGYYMAGAGYLAQKGNAADMEALSGQVERLIEKTGLPVNDDTKGEAQWLLEKGLALTEEHVLRLHEMNELTFPMAPEKAALLSADALSVGLPADKGNVTMQTQTGSVGYVASAIEINEKTQVLGEDEIAMTLRENRSMTLQQLFYSYEKLHVNTQDTANANEESGAIVSDASAEKTADMQKLLVHVQMQMSAQANLKLMKLGIRIDMEPLEKLAAQLDKEESLYHATSVAKVSESIENIKDAPAATVGVAVREAWMKSATFTLRHVEATGKELAATYQKAGESYEALMTAPRADLGDRISKAFQNVDVLLQEQGLEPTEENRRAIRILGYNSMEITEENIYEVKEADSLLKQVTTALTPDKTLAMIREGVNPMEMNLDELHAYLRDKEGTEGEMLSYSRFLQKLDASDQITQEERDAYIGIYRLLRQVEKADDAAVGSVVQSDRALSMESLLSAVRTKKAGHVDTKIDDATGLLSEIHAKGTDISEQIGNYFRLRAGELKSELANANYGEAAETERIIDDAAEASEEVYRALADISVPETANNVTAQQALTEGTLYAQLAAFSKDAKKEVEDKLRHITDVLSEGKEAVQEAVEDMVEASQDMIETLTYEEGRVDVRSLTMMNRQLTMVSHHAREESYYVPMENGDDVTMVHVKLIGTGEGRVSIDFKGQEDADRTGATFAVKNGAIEGMIMARSEADTERYRGICEKISENMLQETGLNADISCIYSEEMQLDAFRSVTDDGDDISTGTLYTIAKVFIRTMEDEAKQ
ncbi:MAG: DUF6240 domain-containing protein [Lachnospiraceae bacterium]|nr:DUF6240 domain-containing protein [Lachnospiraceae bacterium]